jgi:glutathione S-transferase
MGFGIADIMLVSCLDWAKFYKFDLPKITMDYHNRMVNRSNYLKARDINYA